MAGAVTYDRFVAGDRVGDYQVEREVGHDATGIVYLATHVVLPRQANLKVTRDSARASAVQLLREACILEAISQPWQPSQPSQSQSQPPQSAQASHAAPVHSGHPGIPRVYECGVLPDRRPWSAIERIVGVTFERFSEPGPVTIADLVVAMRDVADILRHVHERGVVHGGLSASTIVRTQRRRSPYAIVDWGQARTLDADDVTVDPRADIHALGAVAFQALAGTEPEPGLSAATFCPLAPVELVEVIDQMLAEPVVRPPASDVYDRALWLCETLQIAPLIERPRWTPPQGFVPEGVSAAGPGDDSGGFAVRISRTKSR